MNPQSPLFLTVIQSVARWLVAVVVGYLASQGLISDQFSDKTTGEVVTFVAVILAGVFSFGWSWLNQRKLLKTPPPLIALALLLAAGLLAGACAAPMVGSEVSDRSDGGTVRNGSPQSLIYQDSESSGTLTSSGPTRVTVIGPLGIRTYQGGSTPFESYLATPEGYRIGTSSGGNVRAKGFKLSAPDGSVLASADEVEIDSAAPIRALNESLDRLIQYWPQRDRLSVEQTAEVRAMIDSIGKAVPGLAEILVKAFFPAP